MRRSPQPESIEIDAEPQTEEAQAGGDPIVLDAPPAPVAVAAVDPMAGVVGRLIAAYPARAELISAGVTAVGEPVGTHQKYRLADGTILPLEI